MGNRNAAGGRGGATKKMRSALTKSRRKGIMSKLTGKKTNKYSPSRGILNSGASNNGRNVWRPKSVRAK